MTIRALFEGSNASPEDGVHNKIAIAFALDAEYIHAFKVFLTSLYINQSFLDAHLVVYTDDSRVVEDPLVIKAADTIKLVEGAHKDRLYALAMNNVRRPDRQKWNKGTFLKWMTFEQHAQETVIFLDVDMLAIRDINALANLRPEADLVCAPQFRPSIYKDENNLIRSQEDVARILNEWIDRSLPKKRERRVNSGVMILRRSTLSDAFFEKITDFASERVVVNEQSHITRYLEKQQPGWYSFVSSRYNFQESYLSKVNWEHQRQLLSRISILHYAGKGAKPWDKSPTRGIRPSIALWHWYQSEANRLLG